MFCVTNVIKSLPLNCHFLVLWRINACINKVERLNDSSAATVKLNSLILCPSNFARFLSNKNKTQKIKFVMTK